MSSFRACVLGASGFLGSHLVHHLLEAGCHVHAFSRVPRRNPLVTDELMSSCTVFTGDFFNAQDVERALEGCDVCFHLVSTTIPKTSNDDPSRDVRENLSGALDLLECVRRTGVRKVVYTSSGGAIYGKHLMPRISESHPTDPLCSYGIVKLAVEKYLALYHELYGIDYAALRISNPFGPLHRAGAEQGVIGVFLGRILRNEPLHVWGDGSVVRDYIYVEDVARALVLAARMKTEHHVFNIGSGAGLSLNEIIGMMRSVTGRDVVVKYDQNRAFDVPYSVLDVSRALDELDWKASIAFDEGLRRTWEWLCHGSCETA